MGPSFFRLSHLAEKCLTCIENHFFATVEEANSSEVLSWKNSKTDTLIRGVQPNRISNVSKFRSQGVYITCSNVNYGCLGLYFTDFLFLFGKLFSINWQSHTSSNIHKLTLCAFLHLHCQRLPRNRCSRIDWVTLPCAQLLKTQSSSLIIQRLNIRLIKNRKLIQKQELK